MWHNGTMIAPSLRVVLAALLLALLGLVLIVLNGVWVGLLLGTICARFRDLPQIIASLMQIVFFVTPIMWPMAVTDWMPAVFRIMLNVPTPPANVLLAGGTACLSMVVKLTVPV